MKVGDLVRCLHADNVMGLIVKAIHPQSPDYPARHKPLRYEVMVMGSLAGEIASWEEGRTIYPFRPSQLEVVNG